ncbi:Zinc finger protein 609 [Amphibalanus amphitrite]|uniref:Zinc finger protein 609 n=1 Tax=Amphibalanus amphitrite TaxID=1232801 RepID=A0A6A4WZY0_AMPAM|nr:Zinc finger protein 609 [Amphibalanus amphitrite]
MRPIRYGHPVTYPESVSDMCVGTDGLVSRGTLLEPDSLGPCEPGTTVNLEGIVWQETQGGVLVVNVTWRGKTYVGTLLDYTRHHDWAPPRFNDSPTAELESRSGKGRGKRGRGAASAPEPTVAETRASAQSKLRSQSKGRRSTANSAGANFTAPASPVKRKGRAADREPAAADRTPNKRSRTSSNTSLSEPASSAPGTPEPAAAAPPSPAPTPPAATTPAPLIECPESGCSKKYRHVNGLKYHQSHAHSNGLSEGERETGDSSPESPAASKTPPSSAGVGGRHGPDPDGAADPAGGAALARSGDGVGGAGHVTAVTPQSQLTGLSAPPPPPPPPPVAGEPPAAEPRPTHAKVQISDSNGNVKTSGVLRFGPTAVPTASAAAGPGPALLAGGPAPLRAAASVYQPAAPPPALGAVSRPSAAAAAVTTAARTVPVMAAVDAAKYKPKSVAARVATPALPVVTVPPASGGFGQSVAHLKPIQPKPTILGETSAINPALESLRKDKERPKKRRKENGARTPDASPRPEGVDPSRLAPRTAPGVVSGSVVPPVVSSLPLGVGAGAVSSGVPTGAVGPAERPSRDGTASPAYSDISDDGAPVDASGRPAPAGIAAADKKELPGALPPSSVYYRSFFSPPGVYVPPPAAGKPGADGVDSKEGARGPPPAGEYAGGQLSYLSYPYLPAAYPYPAIDPAGYPLPMMADPKYKAALAGERPAVSWRPNGRPPTSSAGPAPPPTTAADKRPADAAALAARAAAYGYPFGLPGMPSLPYGPVLLNGGYPARFPVSSAAAVSAAPEDLSRAATTAASRASEVSSAAVRGAPYPPPPAHRLLEVPDRARTTASAAPASSGAAVRAGSPGSPLSAPLRPGLGFPPPGGYHPFTGVPGGGPSPSFAPIK